MKDGAEESLASQREAQKQLDTKTRRVFVVCWSAFLAACVGFVVFFAIFDPELLGDAAARPFHMSRMGGYAMGFLFLWVIAAISGFMTMVLRRKAPPGQPS